jgi:hypothetical protein
MNVIVMLRILFLMVCVMPLQAIADETPATSFDQNIQSMDADRDGQVTVSEVRAYLESRHGKGYKQVLLDDMETKAGLKSCGSPFSKSLY